VTARCRPRPGVDTPRSPGCNRGDLATRVTRTTTSHSEPGRGAGHLDGRSIALGALWHRRDWPRIRACRSTSLTHMHREARYGVGE
jgi:hypothetical protein